MTGNRRASARHKVAGTGQSVRAYSAQCNKNYNEEIMKSRFARILATLFAALGGAYVSVAQSAAPADPAPNYPARPVRVIVPFPPGGSNDIMGRYFAQYLTERLNR